MISIILPVYLGATPNSARNKETKFIRAIESVIHQTSTDWELIIISDGDERASEIMRGLEILKGRNVKGIQIEKRGDFTGFPRNAGIDSASGEWICYLDADDQFGKNHIRILQDQLNGEWLFFNDLIWNKGTKVFQERECSLKVYHCGTSNIIHKRDLEARWADRNHYGLDDWNFIQRLKGFDKGRTQETPEYCVCHIPKNYDV